MNTIRSEYGFVSQQYLPISTTTVTNLNADVSAQLMNVSNPISSAVMLLPHSASMGVKWSDIDSEGTRCPVHFSGATSLRKVTRDSGKRLCLADYWALSAGRVQSVTWRN
jgi:hypothetical protein